MVREDMISSLLSLKGYRQVWLFVFLNGIDILLTHYVLQLGGIELNPLYLLGNNLILTKSIFVAATLFGLAIFKRLSLLKYLNIGLGILTCWNTVCLLYLRG